MQRSLLLFTFILSAVTSYVASDTRTLRLVSTLFRNDYDFQPDLSAFYKLHKKPMTWTDARTMCDREGAELVAPESSEEIEMLKSVLINLNGQSSFLYLGIHSLFAKGHVVSLSDVNIEDMNLQWEIGEPDNYQNMQDCITLNFNGKISDTKCNDLCPFVCKRKAKNISWNNNCNTYDTAYQLAQFASACYKLHTEPKNWTTAYDVCKSEGGHLAIINSIEEKNFLVKLGERHPSSAVMGDVEKEIIIIGFHSLFVEREYRTLEGQTLTQAGYSTFYAGQPDNAAPEERCGSMFRNGLLNDIWCNRAALFICERELS